jgi:hypothetical protein
MPDLGARVVDDAIPVFAQPEAEVGLLVIGRRKADIEPAEPLEELAPHQQERARTIVDLPAELAFRRIGHPVAAVADAAAVAPHDAAGLLQPPVRQDQLAAGRADVLGRE